MEKTLAGRRRNNKAEATLGSETDNRPNNKRNAKKISLHFLCDHTTSVLVNKDN